MSWKTISLITMTIGLTACAPQDALFIKSEDLQRLAARTGDFSVTWEITEENGDLKIVTKKAKTPECRGKFAQEDLERGCFVAERDETLLIEFDLKKNYKGDKWRFTEIKLCEGTSKSDATNCSLSEKQRFDFAVDANGDLVMFPDSGTIDLTQHSPVLRQFSIRNYNFTESNYVYVLKACKEGTTSGPGNCADSDPGGMNRGRGGR